MHRRALPVLTVVLLAGPAGWGATASHEPAPTLKAAELLAKEQLAGPRFKVADAVKCDGYMTAFTLQSDFGSFPAASREMLEVRIREVAALDKLEAVSKTDAFAQAFAASAKKKAAAVGKVVADPVGTAKGVPEGVGRFFKGAGKKAQKGAEDAKDSATGDKDPNAPKTEADEVAKDVAGVSKVKRQWSKQLGVDPYTSNTVLSKKLDDIAWAAYAGGFAMSVAGAAVPGLGMVQRANDLAWNLPPQELAALNDGKLTKLGVAEATRKAFLKNRFFTPSLQTTMVTALESMSGVSGANEAVALAASETDSEEDARFYCRTALLLARYHQSAEPVASLQARKRLFVGRTKTGALLVPGALDYLTWAQEIEAFATDPTLKTAKREIWLSGRASPTAAKELAAAGWKLRESALAN